MRNSSSIVMVEGSHYDEFIFEAENDFSYLLFTHWIFQKQQTQPKAIKMLNRRKVLFSSVILQTTTNL